MTAKAEKAKEKRIQMAKPTTTTVELGETFPYAVEVPLTDKELIAYGDELTILETEQNSADAVLDKAKGEHKTETARIAERRSEIMHRLRTKKDFKDLECFNKYDYDNGICEIRRAATNEIVTTRKMTDKEWRGRPLFPEVDVIGGNDDTTGKDLDE